MKIYIGADHRGFKLKERVKPWLTSRGYDLIDCGNTVYDKEDDYPDFAFAVADSIAKVGSLSSPGSLPQAMGIVFCGSGVGVTIAANRVPGARCSTGISTVEVARGRADDDLNILAISADYTLEGEAKAMIETFLTTSFIGDERHSRRLQKIVAREGSRL
ncbi:RpiB/LacA/LacB family sugar-phosphate isomerase [Candidatus Gottesmanbacteria bacterium]|nr:RpiB/LacA/LacB family sugar-phosphate isomerase [Candidatus Gottesmanbacteria bacterium]